MDKKQQKKSTKENNILDPISDKNEETSSSIVKLQKVQTINVKKKLINSEISKLANNLNIPIKKSKRQTLDPDSNNSKKLKPFRRKESNKKFDMNILKRISLQQNNYLNFYNNIKTKDIFRKSESIKKNDTISTNNQKSMGFSSKQNVNMSRSESFLDNKYFSSKKLKLTLLTPNKENFKGQKNMQSSNIFEKLKNSVMFEKTEKLIFRLKICYVFLSLFSLMSITLEITDVILYNKKSDEYLKEKYNIQSNDATETKIYKLIEERPISTRENIIRIFNLIFSLLCVFFFIVDSICKNQF